MHRLSGRRRGQALPLRHHADAHLKTELPAPPQLKSRSLLQSVSFQDFRCLGGSSWSPGAGRHVIVGANGAGKTSILEAIYFLATTKSFRTGRLADCLRWGAQEYRVAGRLLGERGDELAASWGRGRTVRQVNGKSSPLRDYLGRVTALSWSASDERVLDGDPSLRRRLLDQGVVSRKPLEVEALTGYRRVLSAKRRLLATGGGVSPENLEPWNELLAKAGHQLLVLRHGYVEELEQALVETVAESGVALPRVALRYRPNPSGGMESVEGFRTALESVLERELRQRRVLAGPHLDRLEIGWGGADIGRSASGGERKLFGLALTAARRRVLLAAGRDPIVLLDDLDAALDSGRLASVWGLLDGAAQVFMTSARSDTGSRVSGVTGWRLEDGRIDRL